MKPLLLEVEGLYSYRQRTTVDFENLTRAGLFGIFGPVGSGKSALLEAITFALFGETARMSRNERSYNMMNLRSEKLFIEFRFQVRGQIYKFTASSSRNSKDFNEIRNLKRGAYVQEGEEWLPLEGGVSENAERIIGLNYLNFRRTIIIPQGKFQEFLQLKQSERTTMLEELFSLEKFNLQNRTSRLSRENQINLSGINGQLEQMVEVTEERAGELSKLLAASKGAGEKSREKLSGLEARETELARMAGLFAEYSQITLGLEAVRDRKKEADRREAEADRLDEVRAFFALPLRRHEEAEQDLALRQEALKEAETEAGVHAEKRKEHDNTFVEFTGEYEKRDAFRLENENLNRLAEYRQKDEELAALLKEKTGQDRTLNLLKARKSEDEMILTALIKGIDEKKKTLPSSAERAALQKWLDDIARLDSIKSKTAGELESLEEELEGIFSESTEFLAAAGTLREFIPSEKAVRLGRFQDMDFLTSIEDDLRLRRDSLREAQHRSLLHQRLADLAGELKPGEPCPLCGALEHPGIDPEPEDSGSGDAIGVATTETPSGVKTVLPAKEDPDLLWEAFGRFRSGLERLADRSSVLQLRIKDGREELATMERETEALLEGFLWGDFASGRPEEDRERLEAFHRLESEIRQDEQKRKAADEELAGRGALLEEALAAAGTIAEKAAALSALADSLRGGIPDEFFESRKDSTVPELLSDAEGWENRLKSLEERKVLLEGEEKSLLAREAALMQKLSDCRARFNESQTLAAERGEELKGFIEKSTFENLEEVRTELEKKISLREERQEIRQIRDEAAGIEERFAVLEKELDGFVYSSGEHERLKEEIAALRQELEEVLRRSGEQEGALRELSERLVEKKKLLEIQKSLLVREENLKTLAGLFKARGFVNYVSTLYLRELVEGANRRFEILCGRSMKLELNEDNSFAVRDFLNGGKLRSVKTLSGGQTFLASLSLALALADSVNAGNRQTGDEGFFFLDEGFGSLDKDSLRVVMEALWSLGKEKRVVGVISHVEEMKEEIPSFIQISRDEERGSVITQG